MWIARNKDNSLFLFNTNKPNRCSEYDDYIGKDTYWVCGNREGIEDYNEMYDLIQLPSSMFPNLKWEDEPIEVDIIRKDTKDLVNKVANL